MDPIEEAAKQRELNMETTRREMERKNQDILRINNPLERDFRFQFNGFWNTVKAGSTKDVPRYLAAHYFKKMSEYIIGERARRMGEDLLAKRKKSGSPDFLDKYVENKEIWEKVPRVDDPTLLADLAPQLVLGVVEEYGMEEPEQEVAQQHTTINYNPIQDQIIASMNTKIPKEEFVKEVTND